MPDPQPFRLRPATKEDTDFLFALYASSRRNELAVLGWNAQQEDAFLRMQFNAQRLWYEQTYGEADHSIMMAGQEPAGRCIVLRGEREIVLVDVTLLPGFQNRGLGTELLYQIIRESEKAGIPLRLQVVRNNPAKRLYERLGFITAQEDPVYCHMERVPLAR